MYLIVIILSLSCQSLTSIPIKRELSKESFIENNEEFIPTNEWQIVKEGQAIPPGLHVRLNLQTGLREAKLLENSKDQPSSNDLVPVSNDEKEQEKISKENLERAFANLDLSKDDIATDPKHEEDIKKKYRSYDELKKDFEAINIKVQTDQEILTNLLQQLTGIDNHENGKTILTDLEYYLHQYDNAIFFADNNGLELLIRLLNSTNTNHEIRHLTCLALGAAFQSNPKVQLKGLNLGFIPHLLRLLNIEQDENIKFRLLFTLSTLLRHFPAAQQNFLEHGGIETIVKLVEQPHSNDKIPNRAMELMTDLITEKDQITDNQRHAYEKINIRDQLIQHGWCSYLSNRLLSINRNDLDQIEKILMAMIPLTDACRMDFVSLLPLLDDIHRRSNPNENSIQILIETLRKNFQQSDL